MLGVVRPQSLFGVVDGHGAAVGKDPLRSCVAERDSNDHDGLGVVTLDGFDGHCALFSPTSGALFGGGLHVERRSGRPGDQDGIDRGQQAAFTEGAQDPTELPGRNQFLGGLQQ